MERNNIDAINNVKDYLTDMSEDKLLSSTYSVLYSWERDSLDEFELFHLLSDVITVVSNVKLVRDLAKEIKV